MVHSDSLTNILLWLLIHPCRAWCPAHRGAGCSVWGRSRKSFVEQKQAARSRPAGHCEPVVVKMSSRNAAMWVWWKSALMSCAAFEASFKLCQLDEAEFHPQGSVFWDLWCILFYSRKKSTWIFNSWSNSGFFHHVFFHKLVNTGQAGVILWLPQPVPCTDIPSPGHQYKCKSINYKSRW